MLRLKNIINNIHKDKITVSWIKSYVLMAIISIIFASAVYLTSVKIVSEQAQQFHSYVFDSIAQNTTDVLENMKRISYGITSNAQLSGVMNIDNPMDYYSNRRVIDLLEDITEYSKTSDAVDLIHIYIEDTDMLIGTKGMLSSQDFYNSYVDRQYISYDEWKASLCSEGKKYYTLKMNSETGSKTYVSFNMVMPKSSYNGRHSAVISSFVNENVFFGTERGDTRADVSDIYIFNEDGELILSKHISDKPVPTTIAEVKSVADNRILTCSGVSVDTMNLYIAVFTPEKIGTWNLTMLKIMFVICAALWVLILIPSVSSFIKRNYSPIDEMLERFGVDREGNEFKQLSRYIQRIVDEKKTLQRGISRQAEALRRDELARLLTNKFKPYYKESIIDKYDIKIEYPKLAVVIIGANNPEELFAEHGTLSEAQRSNDMSFIIENIFGEVLNTDSSLAYSTEIEEKSVFIVNFAVALSDIRKHMDYATDFIDKHFGVSVCYAVSSLHDGYDEIYTAYTEAMEVMKYKILFNDSNNLIYDEANFYNNNIKYGFTEEKEKNLIASIKSGNSPNAEHIISDIFENIRNTRNISIDYVRLMMFDIVISIFKIAEVNEIGRMELVQRFGSEEKLLRGKNLEEMQQAILEFVEKICRYISESSGNTADIAERIKKYVDENYSDVNLCVASIGQAFNTTSAYLSQKFKTSTGETLVGYITKVRLEKAKELMCKTNYNRDTIAAMTGFGHPRTFNRVFKKYEGITPTEYKENADKF